VRCLRPTEKALAAHLFERRSNAHLTAF
jgi:hypothetical protein